MSIQLQHVTKTFGEQKAVNDVSFTVNRGEVVGFLGPNGAGKSTTMKLITGSLKADSGNITVSGNQVNDNIELRKQIGYLPELNPLYGDMYVKEYLQFVAGVYGFAKAKKQKADDAIQLTGLTAEYKKNISQLSKGYKQRVGLAAALIHNPEVLILDEPTSGLDPNQVVEIRNLIKQQGVTKTVLFSSHIMQEVQAVCNRVIIISKGKIVADNALHQLQKTGADTLQVSFGSVINKDWLTSMPSVLSVTDVGNNSFRLQTSNSQETRKAVMEMALQHNTDIISLTNEKQDLEDVFRSLTQ